MNPYGLCKNPATDEEMMKAYRDVAKMWERALIVCFVVALFGFVFLLAGFFSWLSK